MARGPRPSRPPSPCTGPRPSTSFTTGRPSRTGCPTTATSSPAFVKDAVPRFQTMRGHRVERRFGWDCHGLPAEMAAETGAGLSGRQAVIAQGIGSFNDYCRQIVQRTTDAWERYVTRQARWVDFEDNYKTMDLSFMESVLWAFKRLYDKGLAYEGFRVLPYCWECETPLSNFETRQDDSYRDRTDPAVTVRFDLEPVDDGPELLRGPLGLLAWTTTPWTLALEPRPRRRTRARLRGVLLGRPAPRDRRGVPRGLRGRARGRRGPRHRDGGRPRRAPFSPPSSTTSPTRPGAFVVLGEDFVAHGRGHRHRPDGARVRRGRPARLRGGRDTRRLPGGRPGPLHRRGPRPRRHCRSSTPTPPSSSGSRRRGRSCGPRTTPTATRTAGGPTRRSSTGP